MSAQERGLSFRDTKNKTKLNFREHGILTIGRIRHLLAERALNDRLTDNEDPLFPIGEWRLSSRKSKGIVVPVENISDQKAGMRIKIPDEPAIICRRTDIVVAEAPGIKVMIKADALNSPSIRRRLGLFKK